MPSAHQTPLLNKKGEVSAGVYSGTNGTDIQLAYAASDHIGVLAAGSFYHSDRAGSTEGHGHSYGELGVQYHRALGRVGRLELMTGMGTGSAYSNGTYSFANTTSSVKATGDYNKIFIQSNIGLETEVIDLGVSSRFGHAMYSQFETDETVFNERRSATFWEPSLFTRLGWKGIKLEVQLGSSVPMKEEAQVEFDYQPFFFTIGLNINLDDVRSQE